MLARFFGGNSNNGGVHSRETTCIQLPKGLGGLGIRKIVNFNTALLMKTVTRIHDNPQLLLSMAFKDTHHHNLRILSSARNISWGRRGLHQAAIILEKGQVWKVGNGNTLLASSTKWVHGFTLILRDEVRLLEATRLKVADLRDLSTS